MTGKRRRITVESGARPSRTSDLRRKQTRTGRSRNRMVAVPRNKLAFPTSMKSTLRYTERVEFVPTGTAVHQQRYLASGMFDPNVSGVGHQPRGFDQFMDIYETYTVLGSKISINWMYEGYDGPSAISLTGNLVKSTANNDNSPALTPMICGLHKGIETLTAGNGESQMEKDRTQWTFINGQHAAKSTGSSLKVSDFYGKGALVGSAGYTGTKSSDPDNSIFWELFCGRVSDDYPAEQTKVVAYVTIEYDAVFTEPKTLTQS